ncbi:hypothetical protein [Armatimonas sp.]|uniref:hypothetical protein n=1 Tax=Armatimonas sp. TaxID=1872638 RepID=UPI00286A4FC8|nr:hypothetical protein [Armatimonas sp.]
MKKSFLATGISALALIGLGGCGGSSVSPGTPGGPSTPVTRGNAAFNIKWPPRSSDTTRLIPQAANSLLILVTDSNGTQVERRVITRPTGDVLETHIEFNNLDPVRHTFNVSAHPGTSADGTAQARGAVSLDVPTGGTVTQSLRLDSTIDHITLSQTTADIKPGRELLVVATPYDSDGNIVLVAGSWQWLSTNPSALSITYDKGLATFRPGVNSGTTIVTAKDSESGKSATCAVNNRVGTSDPDYNTFIQVENVVDETAKIVIDGNDADWNKIPSYADTGDPVSDATRNILSSSVVATRDSFYVRIRTAAAPSTSAAKTYWAGFDIANTYQATDFEIGFSADGKKTQIRYIANVGDPIVTGEFDLAPQFVKYGTVIEARLPYAVLKTLLPANLANALDNPRPLLRLVAKTVDSTVSPVVLIDRGAVTGTYLIQATPFLLDPPLPMPGSAPINLRVPADGRWYISQGGFSDSNGQGNSGVGTSIGAWSVVLDKRNESGILSNPENSVTSSNYFGWNQNIIAPANGSIITLTESVSDINALSNPPSATSANFLQLSVGGGLSVLLSSLQKNSVVPNAGDSVSEGDTVAKLGTTGWVNWPQIGLSLRDAGNTTYPIGFKNVRICLSPIAVDPWERKRASWDAREGFYIEKQ